ncbi:MAG: carboxypeptidase regulatory-like domain-containing protein, partial [Pedobacter sp.]
MKNLFPLMLITLMSLAACKKNITDVKAKADLSGPSATGKIIGEISPAGAGKEVMVSTTLDGQLKAYSVKPDINGNFVFEALPAAEYVVSFAAVNGFKIPANKTIQVKDGQTSDAGTSIFTEGASGGITGVILPADASLTVTMSALIDGKGHVYSAKPGQDGAFSFSGLPPSSYTLTFTTAAGYLPPAEFITVKVIAGKSFDVGSITFAPRNSGSIGGLIRPAGVVSSVSTTAIVNGQTVTYKAAVDAQGAFKFTNLFPGYYVLRYTLTGDYELPDVPEIKVVTGELTDVGTLHFPVSNTTGGITGTIDRPSLVTGLVAIRMANIYIRHYGFVDEETGRFLINKLPPGDYMISYVTKSYGSYYAPGISNVVVKAGQTTDVGLKNIQDVVLGSISGTISPAGSVSGMTATSDATGRNYKVVPDASGNFKLSGLAYGKYFVSATPAAGSNLFAPYRKPVSIGNGQDLDMGNIELTTTAAPYPVAFEANGIAYKTVNGDIDAYYSSSTFG